MNSQVADLVGDRDGGRASTPRSHPYPFPLPRITTAAKKPLTVEEADSFTSSCAGMTATERSENQNAIALHQGAVEIGSGGHYAAIGNATAAQTLDTSVSLWFKPF